MWYFIMINNLYSTKTPYIVIVYTLCIVITTFHTQWMCNPVRIYGNEWMNEVHFQQNGEPISDNTTMDSGNLFASPLNDWRSERAPPYINLWEIPSCILVPIIHTLCCIPDLHRQCWVYFSQITPLQWIKPKLCLVGFPKLFPPLALCSHVLYLPGWNVQS